MIWLIILSVVGLVAIGVLGFLAWWVVNLCKGWNKL